MGEIFGRVSKHVAVVEYSVAMCTAWPTSNIICNVAHVITHNKCTQQIAILAPTCIMTYDTPFYGSLWLHSSKQHLLLYHTLHVCDNVSLFMDQLLTFQLFSDHFSCPLVT